MCWNWQTGESQKLLGASPWGFKSLHPHSNFSIPHLGGLLVPKPRLPDKDFPWTPELAYAIGLLTTDGNLSKDGRHITLRSSDLQLLETFRRCLNLTRSGPIVLTKRTGWAKKPSFRVQFSNVQFYRWLTKIGLHPAKTYTLGELRVPDAYFPNFLRGHLDGDGSITVSRDTYNTFKHPKYVYTRLYVSFLSASKQHVDWIQSKISVLLGIQGHRSHYSRKGNGRHATMWKLRCAKKDSLKLLARLYHRQDIPCLERKREIAKQRLIPSWEEGDTDSESSQKVLGLP